MTKSDVDSAMRVLVAACGEAGHFGRVTRDEATGELQVVYAVRGRSAKQFLDALGDARADSWSKRLLRSFLPPSGDPR